MPDVSVRTATDRTIVADYVDLHHRPHASVADNSFASFHAGRALVDLGW